MSKSIILLIPLFILALLWIPSTSFAQSETVFSLPSAGAPPAANASTALTYHVFPQFADGVLPDGSSYRTTLMISNPSATATAVCAVQLRGLSSPGFSLNYSIRPNGWVISPTTGTQQFQSGYAGLQCSSAVQAQLLYSYYDASSAKLSEATVFSSSASGGVQIVADNRNGSQTAIAIANDGDQDGTYFISAYDTTGRLLGLNSKVLPARTNYAGYVSDLIRLPSDFLGQVRVLSCQLGRPGTGTCSASVIGLRYTGATFTTVPGVTLTSLGATANTYHVFPQFADGVLSDGSYYHTTVLFTNSSTGSGSCTFTLYGLTVNGSNLFTYDNIAPGSWAATTSISSMQPISSGYATLSCTAAVESQLLYSFYSADGTKLSEATVFSSPPSSSVQILADNRQGAEVAVAVANDSDQTASYAITAYDANGTAVASTTQQLAPRSTVAAFSTKLFRNLPANFAGRVSVSSANGTASIIGLRFTGRIFTTIPQAAFTPVP